MSEKQRPFLPPNPAPMHIEEAVEALFGTMLLDMSKANRLILLRAARDRAEAELRAEVAQSTAALSDRKPRKRREAKTPRAEKGGAP